MERRGNVRDLEVGREPDDDDDDDDGICPPPCTTRSPLPQASSLLIASHGCGAPCLPFILITLPLHQAEPSYKIFFL